MCFSLFLQLPHLTQENRELSIESRSGSAALGLVLFFCQLPFRLIVTWTAWQCIHSRCVLNFSQVFVELLQNSGNRLEISFYHQWCALNLFPEFCPLSSLQSDPSQQSIFCCAHGSLFHSESLLHVQERQAKNCRTWNTHLVNSQMFSPQIDSVLLKSTRNIHQTNMFLPHMLSLVYEDEEAKGTKAVVVFYTTMCAVRKVWNSKVRALTKTEAQTYWRNFWQTWDSLVMFLSFRLFFFRL